MTDTQKNSKAYLYCKKCLTKFDNPIHNRQHDLKGQHHVTFKYERSLFASIL